MDISSIVQTIAVYAIPLIFAITIHETAHGYVAKLCGDQTAYMLGRLTLNPIKHIDPVGTILVPGALLIGSALSGMSGIVFGWAKPVPINFRNLRNPKTDMIWVAAAVPRQSDPSHPLDHRTQNFDLHGHLRRLLHKNVCGRRQLQHRAHGIEPDSDSSSGRRPHCYRSSASGNGLAVLKNRAVRNVDFVCADSDGNFVLLYASVHENGTGNRSVVHLVRG